MDYEHALKYIYNELLNTPNPKEQWEVISKFVISHQEDSVAECKCGIKHALNDKQRKAAVKKIARAKKDGDTNALILAVAQLQECPTKDLV